MVTASLWHICENITIQLYFQYVKIFPFFLKKMRKSAFCLCKNKDADQLHNNCAAEQRLVLAI